MKRLTLTAMVLPLVAVACAHTTEAGTQVAATSPSDGAQALRISRSGSQAPRQGPAESFTGAVRVDPLFQAKAPSRTSGASVTFEPGARSAWHAHPLGQVLLVTEGVGRVQRWGDPAEEIRPGDVVWIPPGQKHWHGASPEHRMTHIAVLEHLDGKTTEWMEKVSDAQYGAPTTEGRPPSEVPARTGAGGAGQPTRAQSLIGDFSPKMVELTDGVLFGDIWERPELSKRDRSLVTVSALIAMNRPDQLRSHFARARENGVKREELIETITHLAFYAGWPSAMTALAVAKDVFEAR
ncbi:cupin domain-containing protein [Myxococcus llanfairpwllgwyngyllgogerychwyrndrobwllllantysiliogogogochensis]|uniref:Cupin domain-containing protein n=1 Tax=Myxococcus llanfairpwllgwyngyllgogerychwyrndrobwllllantysiliogogogochensis TaxID=2590453 RepID=A0A540WWT0_9BACT|nr:carboxymuconolactone decarboxylase family protein [Myxococcus llanfairpwllgwyngyllgogerychwyrndrobwllllantysiliogogogochensis]TQF12894.1 cupin domain-containing protein [Myxococcus llanfairpwllgwyngyllgogerychwyrndrobwllllantysiliogogogochensis]